MKKLIAVFSAVMLLASVAAAKPSSRTFKATPEQVYASAYRVLAVHRKVQSADKDAGVISFKTVQHLWTAGRLEGDVVISKGKNPGETEMVISVEKANPLEIHNRVASDIFKWVQEELDKQ